MIQPNAEKYPRFCGQSNFARLVSEYTFHNYCSSCTKKDSNQLHHQEELLDKQIQKVDVGIIGIPFDIGTTFRPGARFGPSAIRNHSRLLRGYSLYQEVHPFRDLSVSDLGDFSITPMSISQSIIMIQNQMTNLLQNDAHCCITLGGDHTISYPVISSLYHHINEQKGVGVKGLKGENEEKGLKGENEEKGLKGENEHNEQKQKIGLIHFDAHYDTWDSYFGEKCTHGTPFKRLFDENIIDAKHSVHIGIRGSVNSIEDVHNDQSFGFLSIYAQEFEETSKEDILQKLLTHLDITIPYYLSIDIDVLDISIAPGTGTPEPGGLTYRELLYMLKKLAVNSNIQFIGADLVEVSPSYDTTSNTAQVAANIVFEILATFAVMKKKEKEKENERVKEKEIRNQINPNCFF